MATQVPPHTALCPAPRHRGRSQNDGTLPPQEMKHLPDSLRWQGGCPRLSPGRCRSRPGFVLGLGGSCSTPQTEHRGTKAHVTSCIRRARQQPGWKSRILNYRSIFKHRCAQICLTRSLSSQCCSRSSCQGLG